MIMLKAYTFALVSGVLAASTALASDADQARLHFIVGGSPAGKGVGLSLSYTLDYGLRAGMAIAGLGLGDGSIHSIEATLGYRLLANSLAADHTGWQGSITGSGGVLFGGNERSRGEQVAHQETKNALAKIDLEATHITDGIGFSAGVSGGVVICFDREGPQNPDVSYESYAIGPYFMAGMGLSF
jgi:hypothetical protein